MMHGGIPMLKTIKTNTFVLAVMAIACTAMAVPATSTDYSIYPHLDRVLLPDIEFTGMAAYSLWGEDYFAVTDNGSGLHIFQVIADEAVAVGNVSVIGNEMGVTVADWHAYVATEDARLTAVLVSIPSSPLVAGNIQLPSLPVQMAASGTHVFAACGTDGLIIVDATNSNAMTVAFTLPGNVTSVSQSTDRLGVINSGLFELYDISSPDSPQMLGSHALIDQWGQPLNYNLVLLEADQAYAQDTNFRGPYLLDVTDPTDITAVTMPTNGKTAAKKFGSSSSSLLWARGNVAMFDKVTGALQRVTESFGYANEVIGGGGKIFARTNKTLGIYSDGIPTLAPLSGQIDFSALLNPHGLMLGDILFGTTVAAPYGVSAVELGGAGGLAWSADLGFGAVDVAQITAEGGLLAALSVDGTLRLVSASRYGATAHGSLSFASFVPFGGRAKMAFLDAQTLVIGDSDVANDGFGVLHVIDVSDPDQPAELVTLPLSQSWSHDEVLVSAGRILAAKRDAVEIFDATDLANITSVGVHVFSDWCRSIAVTGNTLVTHHVGPFAISANTDWLKTWDITNPISAVLKAEINLSGGQYRELTLVGHRAYQAGTGRILDLSDSNNPHTVGNFVHQGGGYEMARVIANSEYIVTAADFRAASGTAYFQGAPGATGEVSAIADETPLRTIGLAVTAAPNPFNPRVGIRFELAKPALTTVEIFDLRGHLVAHLGTNSRESGAHVLTWDGVDRQGRSLPSGTYLARVRTAYEAQTVKMVLAR